MAAKEIIFSSGARAEIAKGLNMLANAVNRFTEKPYVLAGLAMWWGYVWSWLQGKPRYENPEFRRFLRRWQWRALVVGKQRAVQEVLSENAPPKMSSPRT